MLTYQSDEQGHVSSWGSSPIKLSAEFNQDPCHILSPVPLPESDQLMSVLIEQQTSQRLFIDYLLASWKWHCTMFSHLQSVLWKLTGKSKLIRQILLLLFPFNEFNYMCLTDFLMFTKNITPQDFIWCTVKKTLNINYSARNYPEGSVYWCNFRHGSEDNISWLEFSTPLSRGIGVFFLLTGLYLSLLVVQWKSKKATTTTGTPAVTSATPSMPETVRHGAVPATHTTSRTTANVSSPPWWRDCRRFSMEPSSACYINLFLRSCRCHLGGVPLQSW